MANSVAIIGLGYVGLPLACLCAEKGLAVKGLETDKNKVRLVNAGKSPIKDAALEKKLPELKGKIVATGDSAALREASVVIICVPTPAVNGKPDLHALKSATETAAKNLQKGQLVVIESTVYPGTTREIIAPILEKSGLKPGTDFHVAHCPERIDPGNKKWTIENIPRVLAGLTKKCSEKALAFYKQIIDAEITVLNSIEAAEAVKVVENTFRDVNIAFVNELAKSFDKMGIDVSEVIKGTSTKPFGYMPFYPGPGVGGHCIAQDPYYLIASAKKAGFEHRFLKLAREINKSMPEYVVQLLEAEMQKLGLQYENAAIAVLGIAYKADVDDARESPAKHIVELLKRKGAKLHVLDPFLPKHSNVKTMQEALQGSSCVILATPHRQFIQALTPESLKKNNIKLVIDARNVLGKKAIADAGIAYKGVGR